MGRIRFADVQNLLDNGLQPEELFEQVSIEMGGFRVVRLNDKYNYLKDKNNKLLSNI